MNSASVLHLEDEEIHQVVVGGLLEGIDGLIVSAVPSLSEFGGKLKKDRPDAVVLDGRFFEEPGGRHDFFLPQAFDLARRHGVRAIYVLSGESLADIYAGLGPKRVPDAIFQKGSGEEGSMGVEKIGEVIGAKLRAIYPQLYLH